MSEYEDEMEEPSTCNNVPEYVIKFLREFLPYVFHKTQDHFSKRQIELALINLKYHLLVPEIDFEIGFRYGNNSYSII